MQGYKLIGVTIWIDLVGLVVQPGRPIMQFVKHLNSFHIAYALDHYLVVHQAHSLFEMTLYSLDAKVSPIPVINSQALYDLWKRIVFLTIACQYCALEELMPSSKNPLISGHEFVLDLIVGG